MEWFLEAMHQASSLLFADMLSRPAQWCADCLCTGHAGTLTCNVMEFFKVGALFVSALPCWLLPRY